MYEKGLIAGVIHNGPVLSTIWQDEKFPACFLSYLKVKTECDTETRMAEKLLHT